MYCFEFVGKYIVTCRRNAISARERFLLFEKDSGYGIRMYLWVCTEMFQRGCALAYSTISGIIRS